MSGNSLPWANNPRPTRKEKSKGFGQGSRSNKEKVEVSAGEQHLNREQIDSLIETQPGGMGPSARPELSDEARRHLDACEECQRLVRMHEEIERRLGGLKDEAEAAPTKDCPPLKTWWELTSGILSEGRAEKLLEHATNCGHCGPLLRQAIEDLSGGPRAEEELALKRLESANPSWQANLAETLAVAQSPSRTKTKKAVPVPPKAALLTSSFPRWMYAAAALLVVALGGTGIFLALHKPSADQLLAQAYSEQRTLELRIPGAPYAPMRVERGAKGSRFDHPAALLEAEAIIAKNLVEHPSDPYWLGERGRAELLDGKNSAAIDSFTRALAAKPNTPNLERDLATAYFQRAEAENRAVDYGTAIKLLGEALAKTPKDPVALFNRAIANEKLFLYDEAIRDWEEYLKTDSAGAWAAEGQRRLDALRQKKKLMN
jgi:tetratricopeptide (TPR) repeat protein